MALQTTLHWLLKIGEEPQYIDENILDFIFHGNHVNRESTVFFIPQLLQEVYYVSQLSRERNNEPNEILSFQDKVYDYIRVFHSRIREILESHHQDLVEPINSVEIRERLREFNGKGVGSFVQANLPEPFLSRNAAYMIFNILPSPYKSRLPHYARCDIVSSYNYFEQYWNKGMSLLCEMQHDVHTVAIDELKKLLANLSGKNKDLCKDYLKDKNGCFSLTEVKKNGLQQDVLCFSGQKFNKKITEALRLIERSGHFRNPIIITKSDKVRYYICPERYVTFAEACKTNKAYQPRMFSCCERKTFAEYDWNNVESYTMTVKYQPCELCQLPISEHTMKYRGRIMAGIKLAPLGKIPLFNAIAEEIYKENH